MYLLCEKTFSNGTMKPSRLLDHFKKIHSDKKDNSLAYFQSLCDRMQKQKTVTSMFSNSSKQATDGLQVSYIISLLIAQSGKPHTIGETLILPAVDKVLRTVLHKLPEQVTKSIPLSNNTVQRRVDEMSDNMEEQLCLILKTTEFSLQLGESTLPDKKSLLLTSVRFVKDENLMEEFLFAKELETHTTGESVFQLVVGFFNEKEIPLTNIVSCATDGAPSMLSRYRGYIKYLKEAVPGVLTEHGVTHRQNLVAKNISGRLHHSLSIVIRAVNTIKALALNSRLFRQQCAENDEEFKQLLLHTEVRWLSKGNCLRRFYSLFSTVVEFFQALDDSVNLELISIKADIAYLSDILMKFNEVNLQLQGNLVKLIKVKSTVLAFIFKLKLYKPNLDRPELFQFPSLAELEKKKAPY